MCNTNICPDCKAELSQLAGKPYCIMCGDFITPKVQINEVPAVKVVPVETPAPKKVRCPHYALIKEFFRVAREMGFPTDKVSQDRWRGAIGMLLGHRLESRGELSGAEWAFCTNALRMGKLFI